MNDWRQSFVRKLDTIKKHGVACFEDAAARVILPVFGLYEDFAAANGFQVGAPVQREGVRSFKFALSENAYALISFKSSSFGRVECLGEAFVPGVGHLDPVQNAFDAADLNEDQIRGHFEESLDSFVGALGARLTAPKAKAPREELVEASA